MRSRFRGIAGSRGRHRLGQPGLVHCIAHPEIAAALATQRRGSIAAMLVPARHSLHGLRRRAVLTGRLTPAATS